MSNGEHPTGGMKKALSLGHIRSEKASYRPFRRFRRFVNELPVKHAYRSDRHIPMQDRVRFLQG